MVRIFVMVLSIMSKWAWGALGSFFLEIGVMSRASCAKEDGLENTVLLNGGGQFLQRLGIEALAGLVGVSLKMGKFERVDAAFLIR
jgi:hypothetical protein